MFRHFYEGKIIVTFCLFSCKEIPSEKEPTLEGRVQDAPEFFPIRVHPFSERKQANFERVAFSISVSVSLNPCHAE